MALIVIGMIPFFLVAGLAKPIEIGTEIIMFQALQTMRGHDPCRIGKPVAGRDQYDFFKCVIAIFFTKTEPVKCGHLPVNQQRVIRRIAVMLQIKRRVESPPHLPRASRIMLLVRIKGPVESTGTKALIKAASAAG